MDATQLKEKARTIREEVIKMLVTAGSGHAGGPLGSADFWTALFFGDVLNYKASDPEWEERDRVVLSAGHYCPVLYTCLAEAGYFDKTELSSLRKINSRVQGHPVVKCLPGVETSSGPLGQGISQAIGMALSSRMDNKKWKTICFMGDGEQNEGQVWEGYMFCGKEKLNNLILVVDRNNMQIDGHTDQVMPLEPFKRKLESFNLKVLEVDGHNFVEILEALNSAKREFERTTVIILNTIPGKGVSFMEDKPEWHGKVPDVQEAKAALEELRARNL